MNVCRWCGAKIQWWAPYAWSEAAWRADDTSDLCANRLEPRDIGGRIAVHEPLIPDLDDPDAIRTWLA